MFNKTVIIFSLVCLCLGAVFCLFNSALEFLFLDIKFLVAAGGYGPFDISRNIVIISIDEYSEQSLGISVEGKSWRRYDPLVIEILLAGGASIITYDIQYSHEQTSWDKQLADAFEKAQWVITGEEEAGMTQEELRQNVYTTASPAITTLSGIPRKVYKYAGKSKQQTLSFAVLYTYADYLAEIKQDPAAGSALAGRLDALDDFWINYRYPVTYFPVFSYRDVLNSTYNSAQPAERKLGNREQTHLSIFKDKIVILAKDFPKDRIILPNLSGDKYFGGLVHAYTIESFLQDDVLIPSPFYISLIMVVAAILLVQLLFINMNRFLRIILLAVLFTGCWVITVLVFENGNTWLNYSAFFVSAVFMIIFNISYKRRLLARNFQQVKKEIQRLEQYNHVLEKAAEMRDILTDTIVHDIKNSIAAVEGSLLYVTEKYKNDKYTLQTFHAANVACQDIINLSSNLLDVRKIEEGQMEFNTQVCPYSEILEVIQHITRFPLFHEKKIDIEIIPPDFRTELYADRYLLEQIIHNLLSNSMKYTPTGGKIKIYFTSNDGEIVINFYNTGVPISDAQKEIIFEKYIRLGKGRSRYSKGLGLYFCRMAMGIHKGRIWVTTDATGNFFHLGFKVAGDNT